METSYANDLLGLDFTLPIPSASENGPMLLDLEDTFEKHHDFQKNGPDLQIADSPSHYPAPADVTAGMVAYASYTDDLLGLSSPDIAPSIPLKRPVSLGSDELYYECNGTSTSEPDLLMADAPDQPSQLCEAATAKEERTSVNADLIALESVEVALIVSPASSIPLDVDGMHDQRNLDFTTGATLEIAQPAEQAAMVGEVVAVGSEENAQDLSDVSESEQEEANSTPKQKISKRKLEDTRCFESWRRRHAKIITDEEIRSCKKAVAGGQLTLRELIQNDQPSIIGDAREYQLELFERAKKQNSIAVLDTGSGKTLIAVLLLRHIIDQELEDRAMGKKPRIAFFLVDSVALVFQQHLVLERNVDQPIQKFCGEMGTDHWAKATWQEHLRENMVIVCTAEILYQCLWRSFIRLDQINLLIFDEAHHAKKNHPYARIIKDYYINEADLSKRPKIFGMTASPVDVRSNFTQAAKELEAMLHCQIVTAADLALLRTSVSRPNESVAVYPKLHSPRQTILCQEMEAKCGDMKILAKTFRKAVDATIQLGVWCADQVWSLAMAEPAALKFEMKIHKYSTKERDNKPVEMINAELSRLREAQAFVQEWSFEEPATDTNCLSPKVLVLHSYLNLIFERPTDARCIVFVHQRYTAQLLGELFTRIGPPHLRLGTLVGNNEGNSGELTMNFRRQQEVIHKFRKGELNCLFATSVAEEGLDVPECNLVIRFDLYDTLIQYIQSRGRARHANSKYLHMVEQDNQAHIQAVREVRQGEDVLRRFCESLPADRLLQGNDVDVEDALVKEKLLQTFVDPISGAKLTYSSSLVVLGHFVSTLPGASSAPNFIVTAEHGLYTCSVVLPSESPVHSATGRPSSRKAIAKRSAAFEACVLLRKGGHLDENLLSTHHKHLPAMRNAHLALSLHKSSSYDMKLKPTIWQESRGSAPESLYMTVLMLEKPENLGRESQPIALLTRKCMPDLPSVLLHLQVDKTSNLIFDSLQGSIPVTQNSLSRLNAFTLRIYKDIFNKRFEVNEVAMSYWFAPVVKTFKCISRQRSSPGLIDWAVVNYVHDNEAWTWDIDCSHAELEDRYLVDKWDGGRRFWGVKVMPDLRPLDPVPDGAAPHRYMNTILDYSVSLFSKSRKRAVWRQDQPVIYAHRILHRLNWLDEYTEKEYNIKMDAYVCPEPLLFSALPTSTAAMAYLLPSAISRIESYLIALEACGMLGLSIRPELALEAITKDSDNTEEHRAEQIHFQRGMGKNYERLEFIGDCFLKMATSISIFCLSPNNDEFEYHVRRMLLICNKNLFHVAVEKKLYEYIRSVGFSRRTWYPEGIKLLEGKGFKKTGDEVHKHQLGDKTIADVCEALIGAALLSHNSNGNMDMAVKAVSVLVSHSDHTVSQWADYCKLYTKPAYQLSEASAIQTNLALQIKQKMGYHFQYPRLLMSAFVHPSLPSFGGIPCYQRLEFLGDSLLDMACVNFIFHRHPDRDPQWLTEHKMAMVSNKFLAALSVKLGFHKHLRFSSAVIEYQNRDYAQEIQEAERESNGARDYWTTTKNPPKCLSDIVESYLGAVFVDSEFNFAEIERFFDKHIRWFFEDMSIYDTFANHHPVTHLHNLLTLSLGCSTYRIMASPIPNAAGTDIKHQVAVVMVHGEVITSGTAASSKNAKIKAAEKALGVLKGLAPFEFRQKFGCACKEANEVEGKGLEDVGTAI
ncbi:MAG: hypothetical protein Q9201_004601 [Fulgogasparrea decipioides]